MSPLPDYKTIVDLIKKGSTIEAQEQIMELREAAIALKAENTQLKEQVAELKKQLEMKEAIVWQDPYYFLVNGEAKDGPYCQHCYDKESKLIRLQKWGKGWWKCQCCENDVFDRDYVPPNPTFRIPRRGVDEF